MIEHLNEIVNYCKAHPSCSGCEFAVMDDESFGHCGLDDMPYRWELPDGNKE